MGLKQVEEFLNVVVIIFRIKHRNHSDYQSQNSTISMFYWKHDYNNI